MSGDISECLFALECVGVRLCVCVCELLLPLRGVGRYLPALPVQTPNSWKQTLTTGALCLGEEGESEEDGEAGEA